MKDILDMHMHTLMSGHAYSTLSEMIAAGRKKGLELIGITEHTPSMPGTCHEIYFHNFKVINRHPDNIELMMGAEVNIMDFQGNLDVSEETLKKLDYAIASLHDLCIEPGSLQDNTAALLKAIANPYINIIGHPDNGYYPVDFVAVAQAAHEHHVLLELNNSSYAPTSGRIGSRENALEMLKQCQKYHTSIIMDSDAHIDGDVGNHQYSQELLQQANFPEELIINTSVDKFKNYLNLKL
ncbi:phosphatase [Pectinatus brassicae]|uniref:Putative hydrolase n=1 Tax=Pectinatus brassicae TaxID=862415 RepID=A0A840UQV5_9FIRM|nr:phosphatase [Pectinatus brassicae]MBB5335214.1 putative hydrolase [Pectinatus brassicae]